AIQTPLRKQSRLRSRQTISLSLSWKQSPKTNRSLQSEAHFTFRASLYAGSEWGAPCRGGGLGAAVALESIILIRHDSNQSRPQKGIYGSVMVDRASVAEVCSYSADKRPVRVWPILYWGFPRANVIFFARVSLCVRVRVLTAETGFQIGRT